MNNTGYRIEFYEPNSFELKRPINNAGAYEVLNSYIRLTYDSNGTTVDIPYLWNDDGLIVLNPADGFDVSSN